MKTVKQFESERERLEYEAAKRDKKKNIIVAIIHFIIAVPSAVLPFLLTDMSFHPDVLIRSKTGLYILIGIAVLSAVTSVIAGVLRLLESDAYTFFAIAGILLFILIFVLYVILFVIKYLVDIRVADLKEHN